MTRIPAANEKRNQEISHAVINFKLPICASGRFCFAIISFVDDDDDYVALESKMYT